MTSYQERKEEKGVGAARLFLRDLLDQHQGNVSKVAYIAKCTRKCVYRARDGTLEDVSRAPRTPCSFKTAYDFEELILKEREETKYGRIRMSRHMEVKYGLHISSNTIRNIYRRNMVKRVVYTRSSNAPKPLYDYENILPFEHIQIDTKHIEDYGALGQLAFIPRKYGLPLYQWTAIDAKTKAKFLAYSSTLSAAFGMRFMLIVGLHLRAHGIRHTIKFQTDNGPEFCKGSKRKEDEWNAFFQNTINATFTSIPAGKKYLQ